MKKLFTLIVAIVLFSSLWSQNEMDALRFGYTQYYGSARSMAMGNAFGALGADFGAININPASIATFKYSQVSLSPFFAFDQALGEFNGNKTSNFDYKFNLNNFGLVIAGKYLNFGVSVSKIAHFNHSSIVSGINDRGSYLDPLAFNSDGLWPEELDPYSSGLAFDTYLIDTINGNYYTNPLWWSLAEGEYPTYGELQKKAVNSTGRGNKADYAFGMSFNEKLYIGGSLVFESFVYEMSSEYSEDFSEIDQVDLEYFKFNEKLKQEATGFGFALGAIYAPLKNVRLGASFQSPVFLDVHEDYGTKMLSQFKTPDADGYYSYSAEFPEGGTNVYDYNVVTPMHITISGGFLSSVGAISLEVEKVYYNLMKMKSDDFSFDDANEAILKLKEGTNIRAGGEFKFGAMRFRGGAAYYQAPTDIFKDRISLNGGIGFINEFVRFDLAISQNLSGYDKYYFYSGGYSDEPVGRLYFNNISMTATLTILLSE